MADYLEWERQDYQEAVEGIRQGYEDVKAGRTKAADEFFDEFSALSFADEPSLSLFARS